MDAAASWQAFACTGNILRYLDYKQLVQLPAEHPAGETDDVFSFLIFSFFLSCLIWCTDIFFCK